MDKQKLLKEKTKKQSNRIPLVLTHNRTLPHVNRATTNNWNLLHINQEFKDLFQEAPIVTFRRNRNINGLLGWRNIVDGKLQRQSMRKEIRFSTKCFSKLGNLLKTMWHKKTYHMLHDLNCKSKLLIYIMEFRICRIPYVGKCETQLNIRLNNHRRDVNRQNSPQPETA